jgi:invasion protein IalB
MFDKVCSTRGISAALALAVVMAGASAPAFAQKKGDAKPAAAPAAKAEAGAAAPAEKQSAWVKLCETAGLVKKDAEGKDVKDEKKICLTHHERLDGNTGMVLVSAAIREVEGQDKKSLMIMVPLGMAIPPGVRAAVYTPEQWALAAKNEKIDEKTLKPLELKYSLCHPAGCTAEVESSAEFIDSMKKGGGIMVLALNAAAQPIGFPVPLDGFTEAFDGAPVDNEKYAKARGELMNQIRARQAQIVEKMKEEQKAKQDAAKLLDPPPGAAAAAAAAGKDEKKK